MDLAQIGCEHRESHNQQVRARGLSIRVRDYCSPQLRSSTVPVPLAAGLARAAEILASTRSLSSRGHDFPTGPLTSLDGLPHEIYGHHAHMMLHIANLSVTGVDSEALILARMQSSGIATGSACTSLSYTLSHVLTTRGLDEDRAQGTVRMSWWWNTDFSELGHLRETLSTVTPR